MKKYICCLLGFFFFDDDVCGMWKNEVLVIENKLSNRNIAVVGIKEDHSLVGGDLEKEIEKSSSRRLNVSMDEKSDSDDFIELCLCNNGPTHNSKNHIAIKWNYPWNGIYVDKYGKIDDLCWLTKHTERGPVVYMVFEEVGQSGKYASEAARLRGQQASPGFILQSTGIDFK